MEINPNLVWPSNLLNVYIFLTILTILAKIY